MQNFVISKYFYIFAATMQNLCIMKKYLLSLFFLSAVLSLMARTPEEAAALAHDFLMQRTAYQHSVAPSHRVAKQPLTLAFTQYQIDDTTPAVYVFNDSDNHGFVLVSAHDDARPVLGFADAGVFDANAIPENMQFWLRMYADEMACLSSVEPELLHGQQSLQPTVIQRAQQQTYQMVEPLLASTCWGQSEPYNNFCPVIGGEHAPTGCAATAVAQIMYKYQYPHQGIGSHSYTTQSYQLPLSADFWATTYDWQNMLPDYSAGYTATQVTAVATLLSHVGIAAEMDYTSNSSGASASTALNAMIQYFDYDKSIVVLPKDYLKETDMMALIAQDLQEGHPIFFEGRTKNDEGHAFVCDGINADGYLHINWGWDGYSNGYFALSAFNPLNQGVGGSSTNDAYTQSVVAYIGIQPNQGGNYHPFLLASSAKRTSADQITRGSEVTYELNYLYNKGICTAEGALMYYIYDEQNNLVGKASNNSWFDLPVSYYYNSRSLSASLPADLPAGNYQLEIALEDANGNQCPILVKSIGRMRIPIMLTDDAIIFSEEGSAGDSGDSDGSNWLYMPIVDAQLIYQQGSNQWKLDLTSAGFWNSTPSDVDVMIRGVIRSASETSVVGTYILDPTNSGAPGTINADAKFMVGYNRACYQYPATDLHLTITQADNGRLNVQIHMVANNETYDYICQVAPVWAFNNGIGNYYYDASITYELAAQLSASSALQLTQSLAHTEETNMHYFVNGIVSNMHNAPEQIAQYKTARFDISDDGTVAHSLYCNNTRWLNDSDFQTGNEVHAGDEVVIYGTLQHYNADTPEIKGHVYSIQSNNTTGVVNSYSSLPKTNCHKILRHGQLLILCDDKTYSLMGQEM